MYKIYELCPFSIYTDDRLWWKMVEPAILLSTRSFPQCLFAHMQQPRKRPCRGATGQQYKTPAAQLTSKGGFSVCNRAFSSLSLSTSRYTTNARSQYNNEALSALPFIPLPTTVLLPPYSCLPLNPDRGLSLQDISENA